MENSIQIEKTANAKTESHAKPVVVDPFLTKLFGEYEFNRYGLIAVIILAVVCSGSVAVGLGAMSHPLQIAALIFPCVITVSLILAVMPMRTILYSAMVSVTISIILSIVNLV